MSRTIVMIHGMWGGAWCWEKWQGFFEERGWTCRVPTLRHHDYRPEETPPPELARTSVRNYVDDLEEEIRALGSDVVLMGHSMGGLLVQMLAERGLGRVAVLLTPAAPAGILGLTPSVLRSFARVLLHPGFWKKVTTVSYGSMVYSMGHLLPEDERKRVYERLVGESGRATFEIGLWPLDRSRAARVDAAKVRIPLLVVAGEEDRITPARIVRKVARKYGADFKVFPDHAHWVLGEPGWEDVARATAEWIEAQGGASSLSSAAGA